MRLSKRLHYWLRFLIMPGTDIFTRRRVRLEKHWKRGDRQFLDAGCGNGWFSYRAWKSGATVTAVSNQAYLIDKGREFYNEFRGVPTDKLAFRLLNLYNLSDDRQLYDEIICYETLEHILGDQAVCEQFHACLNSGGVLHLCCPNSEHPRWASEDLDLEEQGGHVRYGYTEADYRALLEPIGFTIDRVEDVGGPILVALQEKVQMRVRKWLGEPGALLVAMIAIPFIWFEKRQIKVPFSIYVRAVKPAATVTEAPTST